MKSPWAQATHPALRFSRNPTRARRHSWQNIRICWSQTRASRFNRADCGWSDPMDMPLWRPLSAIGGEQLLSWTCSWGEVEAGATPDTLNWPICLGLFRPKTARDLLNLRKDTITRHL